MEIHKHPHRHLLPMWRCQCGKKLQKHSFLSFFYSLSFSSFTPSALTGQEAWWWCRWWGRRRHRYMTMLLLLAHERELEACSATNGSLVRKPWRTEQELGQQRSSLSKTQINHSKTSTTSFTTTPSSPSSAMANLWQKILNPTTVRHNRHGALPPCHPISPVALRLN